MIHPSILKKLKDAQALRDAAAILEKEVLQELEANQPVKNKNKKSNTSDIDFDNYLIRRGWKIQPKVTKI